MSRVLRDCLALWAGFLVVGCAATPIAERESAVELTQPRICTAVAGLLAAEQRESDLDLLVIVEEIEARRDLQSGACFADAESRGASADSPRRWMGLARVFMLSSAERADWRALRDDEIVRSYGRRFEVLRIDALATPSNTVEYHVRFTSFDAGHGFLRQKTCVLREALGVWEIEESEELSR